MKQRKYLPFLIGGLSAIAVAPAFAEIVKTDAGLAGKRICSSGGADTEVYNRDHTYVYNKEDIAQKYIATKGTWSIAKDGTVTIKTEGGGTWLRRYDVDGDNFKELTGSLLSWGGAPGKRC
jgi:hypothetical protein